MVLFTSLQPVPRLLLDAFDAAARRTSYVVVE